MQTTETRQNHSQSLNIAIASGATSIAVDSIRLITNRSKGTTGARIAEEAAQRGHQVNFLCSKDSKVPFEHKLCLPLTEPQQLLRAIGDMLASIEMQQKAAEKISVDSFLEFDEYREKIVELSKKSGIDVAILAVAASDYGTQKSVGKLSSCEQQLDLSLQRLPKVISEVRAANQRLFLVGFKLELGISSDQLIERAYQSLLDNKLDLVVANCSADSMNPWQMQTYIITPEKGIIPVMRDKLPEHLIRLIEERYSTNYFRSTVNRVDSLPTDPCTVSNFLGWTHSFSNLALFPKYTDTHSGEFGFLAQRTNRGILISGRGCSKSMATEKDIALLTDLNIESRTIEITSLGEKASLNAPAAYQIFRIRPEINFILHAHIEVPGARVIEAHTSPGSVEDIEKIGNAAIDGGTKIIQQKEHGVFILAKSAEEILELLRMSNIYQKHGDDYDLAYSHFTGRSRLIEMFCEKVKKESRVADLAAGTGAVSYGLYQNGFRELTLVDCSLSMLTEARSKLADLLPECRVIHSKLQNWQPDQIYDAAILRQGINYVPESELKIVFANIHSALTDGGTLVFNTFDPCYAQSGLKQSARRTIGNNVICCCDGNLRNGTLIHHGQLTEIYNQSDGSLKKIYDLNTFYALQKEALLQALDEAGFCRVSVSQEGHSLYFIANK